jgi:two-component system, sensor histidine kinase and response regulator
MNSRMSNKPFAVLMFQDNRTDAHHLQELLSTAKPGSFNIDIANNLTDGLKQLSRKTFDAILLKLSLPDSEGFGTLDAVNTAARQTAIIVLDARHDEGLAFEAMMKGAQDFLKKDEMDAPLLARALFHSIARKKAEAVLREGEESYRNILTLAPDPITITRIEDGRYMQVNEAFCQLTGYSAKEAVGQTPFDLNMFVDPGDRERLVTALKTHGRVDGLEIGYRGKDGTTFDALVSASPIRFQDQDCLVLVATVITSLKKAQQDLRKSEEKYREIIDSIQEGYYEVDLKGNYTFVNKALSTMRGYTREEMLDIGYRQYLNPETAKSVFKLFNQVYKTGKPAKGVWDVSHKDGSMRLGESSILLIKDPKGDPIGFRGLMRDITESKKIDEALKASEEKYRTILENIEDGYFEVDLRGKFTFFNEALINITGYSPEEMIHMSNRDYTSKKDAEVAFRRFNKIYKTGLPDKGIQYALIRKDGSSIHVESSASLIKSAEGKPVGFRGLMRDITARKIAELAMQEAVEAAEAATQAKSEFLANMSHEIRTPMNGIMGMYNLLLNTELDAEQTDYVETGKRSADSLLTVINDILDFSKIEAGKLDLETLDFNLRTAMAEMVELPALLAHEKDLEFAYHIDPEIPSFLKGDPGRLRQIFMNLTGNAIKFTKRGEIIARAELLEETKENVKIRFSVKDTGIGISVADCEKLFSSFHQVDASTTRKYGGTGLGLSIAKQLAQMMEGNIGVESEIGQGSTFWFTAVFVKQTHVVEKKYILPESIRGKRILIVDDNKTNLDILRGYLESWGCLCDSSLNGIVGLSLMNAVAKVGAPFDLVITDMRMPEMDGAEFGQIAKKDPLLSQTPIIMLTSQGLRGDAAKMKKIGFSAYLTKPIRRSQLFDCLAMTLGAKVSRDRQKAPPFMTRHSLSEAEKNNIRILLVEDNPINQKLALRLLEKFGFLVDAAATGKEAVSALEKTDYHVVLMDVQMPEMDGFEATRVIRDPDSKVRNHKIPIIAMTAHAMKGDRQRCLKEGMDDYISKPVEPEMLFEAVMRHAIKKDAVKETIP